MKQKVFSLVEVFLELEELVTISDLDVMEKQDLESALRDFVRLFRSLTLEIMDDELKKIYQKIEELKNEKIQV